MNQIVAIAAGGAAGALARYYLSVATYSVLGRGFPYGTLVVNIVGSLLMGYLFVLFTEKLAVSAVMRAGILVGLLGAFTTFSTFSLETLNLVEEGEISKAALNVFISVTLCIIAAWAGMILGRQ